MQNAMPKCFVGSVETDHRRSLDDIAASGRGFAGSLAGDGARGSAFEGSYGVAVGREPVRVLPGVDGLVFEDQEEFIKAGCSDRAGAGPDP